MTAVEQHLHPYADAEERAAAVDCAFDCILEICGAQRGHACPERADARKHDRVSIGDETTVDGEASIRSAALQRLLRRTHVADPIVEHGDQRLVDSWTYSTPFVDGT